VKRTGEVKTYVYYHCTRKKRDIKCYDSKPVTLKELENQIEAKTEEVNIHPEFLKWALEILGKQNDQEINDRTKTYEMQHNTLVQTQKELDNLTRMRYKELIDDETFIKESNSLKGKINQLKENLRQTETRAEKWLELTERTFHFATYARKAFIDGTIEQKREILAALGSNFSFKLKNSSF